MSNALAIASVTAVLKDLLDNGLIDRQVGGAVGGPVVVSALPPDRIEIGDKEKAQLNLFLYHVMPNSGWRNVGLPALDDRGERISNPPLALDLFYLLTAYGKQDLEGEILLGYGTELLHETPVLTRDAIRRSLAPASPVGPGILPPALSALSATDLADQIELIKICMHPMNTEEMYRVWSAFQVSYRPSVAYQASVVLIESRRSTKRALPVRARNLYAVTFRQPLIQQILSRSAPDQPIVADQPILPGYTLVLAGVNLQADDVLVGIGGIEMTPADVSDTLISVILPGGLYAGVQGVQVIQQLPMGTPATAHRGFESNVAAFVLRPTIAASVTHVSSRTVNGVTLSTDDLTVNFNPPVERTQRVVLLLNELNPPATRAARAYSFEAAPRAPTDPPDANALTISSTDVVPGNYLVRVQVDGAESPLEANANGQYTSPQITI